MCLRPSQQTISRDMLKSMYPSLTLYSSIIKKNLSINQSYALVSKHSLADLLNDRVIPLFEEHNMLLIRMLTDKGSQYTSHIHTEALSSRGITISMYKG